MGYIYKIENIINHKIYIGQTTQTIEIRQKEHIDAAKYGHNSVIYRAMRKYGVENFIFTEIEKCNDDSLDDREIYWISYFDTYNNGYNSTIGGQGVQKYNKEKILDLWDSGLTAKEIGEILNTDYRPVIRALISMDITLDEIKQRRDNNRKKCRDDIIHFWNSGLTEGEISKELHLDMSTVKRGLMESGISEAEIMQRGYKKISGSSNDEIMQLWNQGNNQTEIRSMLSVGTQRLKNVLLEYGVTQDEIDERMKNSIGRTRKKPVHQFDLSGNYIKTYSSICEAKKDGFFNINKVINGEYSQCGGYKWSLTKETLQND